VTAQAPRQPQGGDVLASLEWPGDVRDLAAPGGGALPVVLVLLAVAVTLLAGARARARRPAGAAPRPAAGPPVLQRLRALALPAPGADPTPYYLELKALLRAHCRERFGIAAEAATSEELLRLVPPLARARGAGLPACDAVLFAAARPDERRQRADRDELAAFVAATGGGDPGPGLAA
jgi:hypothetical protein